MDISPPCALSDLPVSPWKNGGGSTRTLAVHPPDAAIDDFVWRVSLAEVGSPGKFSLFPGIDRTILLWSGSGLVLRAPGWSHTLGEPLQPFAFKGEETIVCDLIAGPTTDLNVMVRRGLVGASVRAAHETEMVTSPAEAILVLCARGSIEISASGQVEAKLRAGEFVWIQHCEPGTKLTPASSDAEYVLISLSPSERRIDWRNDFSRVERPADS